MQQYSTNEDGAERLAIGLGWFSIALGLAEIAAPHRVARLVGVTADERTTSMLRTAGAREIGTGIAILSQPGRARWLWTRVGGDAIDLALLGGAMGRTDAEGGRVAAAAAAVLGVTALDVVAAQRLARLEDSSLPSARRARRGQVLVEYVVTINRPIDEVYRAWRDFENFPRFMRHLDSVHMLGNGRSRWRATAPAGMRVEWEAETLEDRENEWIAWRSVPGSQIENSGSVRFARAPGARGTEVRVQLQYSPPAGALGRGIAWLFGEEPQQQVRQDLRRFKQLLETGEIPLSDGPAMWRPAQPAADPARIRQLAGVH